jgi:hypothetical protein
MDFPTAGELSSSPLATLSVGNFGTVRVHKARQNIVPGLLSETVVYMHIFYYVDTTKMAEKTSVTVVGICPAGIRLYESEQIILIAHL